MFDFTIDLLDNSPRLDKPNIIQFGWLLSALLIVILCAIIDNQGKPRHRLVPELYLLFAAKEEDEWPF